MKKLKKKLSSFLGLAIERILIVYLPKMMNII